jgi:hypothetical protein
VQSKIAGCGKTCASNYGVDYPNAAQTRERLTENLDFLVGATDADRWSDALPPLEEDDVLFQLQKLTI